MKDTHMLVEMRVEHPCAVQSRLCVDSTSGA